MKGRELEHPKGCSKAHSQVCIQTFDPCWLATQLHSFLFQLNLKFSVTQWKLSAVLLKCVPQTGLEKGWGMLSVMSGELDIFPPS